MGVNLYSFAYRHPRSALEFLEYCHSLGEIFAALRYTRAKRSNRVISFITAVAIVCIVIGVTALITVLSVMNGFEEELRVRILGMASHATISAVQGSLEDWKKFVADSKAKIARALPVLEKYRMPMGIENHKDWTAEEQVVLLREHSSEYLGVCLDTGNNIALLDDPYESIELLAPYAVCTHIKDMAVNECADGFLLSEVPLGAGVLDMQRIVHMIAKARPQTRFTLEMITRDPLRVPCLGEKYWVTFPKRSGVHLARTLTMVRGNKPRAPLPSPEKLDHKARLSLEEDNVKRCLAYAREPLGLRAASAVSSPRSDR